MLKDPGPHGKPLQEAVRETLTAKANEVKLSIPKFIKKSLGMLRREANAIRRQNEEDELSDVN